MKYLLDTNTVSYYLRGIAATVKHVQSHAPPSLAISSITAMELVFGMEKRRSAKLTAAVMGFLYGIQIMPFDRDAALRAGTVRACMERMGVVLALADCQIAGHALALDVIVISTDSAFRQVVGLSVKDWSKS